MAKETKRRRAPRANPVVTERDRIERRFLDMGYTKEQYLEALGLTDSAWRKKFTRDDWKASHVATVARLAAWPAEEVLRRIGIPLRRTICPVVGVVDDLGLVGPMPSPEEFADMPLDARINTVALWSNGPRHPHWVWYFEKPDTVRAIASGKLCWVLTPDGPVVARVGQISIRKRADLELIGGEIRRDVKLIEASPITWIRTRKD